MSAAPNEKPAPVGGAESSQTGGPSWLPLLAFLFCLLCGIAVGVSL